MSATLAPDARWVRRWTDHPQARLLLICCAHAGGGAGSFRAWAPLLPDDVELLAVQYPGREERIDEPVPSSVDELIESAAAALIPVIDRPYVLFGHSMGTLVAHDLAHRLIAAQLDPALRLVVSGRQAPDSDLGGRLHLGTDEELVGEIQRLGGTAPEILRDPGFRRLLVSTLRADYRLVETYCPRERDQLPMPVTAFVGDADTEVDVDRAAGWAAVTNREFDVQQFVGDHFYLGPQRQTVVQALLRRIDPALSGVVVTWPDTP